MSDNGHRATNGARPVLGIDLGTSTCLACVVRDGAPELIRPDLAYPQSDPFRIDYPSPLMPSAFVNRDGEPLTGHRALKELSDPNYADDVIVSVKRFMEVDGSKRFRSGGREYSPSEIAGEFIKVLVCAAERQLELPPRTIEEAVVTVPAGFGSAELAATRRACLAHGSLLHVDFLDEPVAAAYGLGLHEQPGDHLILVADLGGGTFDVTLLRVGRDVGPTGFQELGRDGDPRLGGQDWDREIAEWAAYRGLADATPEQVRALVEGQGFGHNSLMQASERAKIEFFERGGDETNPRISLSFRPDFRARPLDASFTGRWFVDQTAPLADRCASVCERLLADASEETARGTAGCYGKLTGRRVAWADVDAVVMVGGGSNMWTVRRRLAAAWGREPEIREKPEYAVVRGAALAAADRQAGRTVRREGRHRYPFSIGVGARLAGADGFTFHKLIGRNTRLPFAQTFHFTPHYGPRSRGRLRVPLLEEKDDRRGTRHDLIGTLYLEGLPPPEDGRPETIAITIACESESILSVKVGFRGKSLEVDVHELRDRAALRPGALGPDAPEAPAP